MKRNELVGGRMYTCENRCYVFISFQRIGLPGKGIEGVQIRDCVTLEYYALPLDKFLETVTRLATPEKKADKPVPVYTGDDL